MSEAVALGLRAHSGWAAAVTVAGSPIKPIILERGRIETADDRIAGSKQPYHFAKELSGETAETLIRRCRESSTLLATRAVSALVTQVRQNGFTLVGAGILLASGRPLPPLAAILRSHALIHTAEGEFFRDVLVAASKHCSLEVNEGKGARHMGDSRKSVRPPDRESAATNRSAREFGRATWRQDEKFASLAAWIALFGSK
jgi:hypothetical protein